MLYDRRCLFNKLKAHLLIFPAAGSSDNILWSSLSAEKLIKLMGWILKFFSPQTFLKIVFKSTKNLFSIFCHRNFHVFTTSDQNILKIWTHETRKQFSLSQNSPSLACSNYSHLSDKISHRPRVVFRFTLSSKVVSCETKELTAITEGLERVNLIYETLPKCIHFIFEQNLHKILL